jgi:hypothetical protein
MLRYHFESGAFKGNPRWPSQISIINGESPAPAQPSLVLWSDVDGPRPIWLKDLQQVREITHLIVGKWIPPAR